MQVGRSVPSVYGIQLTMVPGNAAYGVEIWRGSDSSAPGTPPTTNLYEVLASPLAVPAGGTAYLDVLPLDGFKRYYQARQVSYTNTNDAGPFTASTTGHTPTAINANPILSFMPLPSVYPLNRAQKYNDGDYTLAANDTGGVQPSSGLYLPSTNKITVGTVAASSFVLKTLVVPYSAFNTVLTGALNSTAGYINAATTAPCLVRAPAQFPIGSRLSTAANSFRMTGWLPTSSAAAPMTITLYRLPSSDPTTPVTLYQVNGSNLEGGGTTNGVLSWGELPNLATATPAISETFGSTNAYELEVNFTGSSANTNVRAARLMVDYLMPTYDVTR